MGLSHEVLRALPSISSGLSGAFPTGFCCQGQEVSFSEGEYSNFQASFSFVFFLSPLWEAAALAPGSGSAPHLPDCSATSPVSHHRPHVHTCPPTLRFSRTVHQNLLVKPRFGGFPSALLIRQFLCPLVFGGLFPRLGALCGPLPFSEIGVWAERLRKDQKRDRQVQGAGRGLRARSAPGSRW